MSNKNTDPYSSIDKLYNLVGTSTNAWGNDIISYSANVDQCANGCYNNPNCVGFVTNPSTNYCWLKNNIDTTQVTQGINLYSINRNNPFASLIQYNNLLLTDGSNKQQLVNTPNECINTCINDPNCKGLNVILNTGQNEVTTDGYNYQNVPPITCEYVSNICYSNAKSENSNSKFFAKKHDLNFDNNTPYLLKMNGGCLSQGPNLVGLNCNDSSNVTPVYFDNKNDMIKIDSQGNNCLAYTPDHGLYTSECNWFDTSQKFIYENVYNTLRPLDDTTLCITAHRINGINLPNPAFSVGIAPFVNPGPENNITFEAYYKPDPKEDYIEYFENDYSVDMRYYIIYMILLCMIAYLVIISSSSNNK
jgi:hypothetical protein